MADDDEFSNIKLSDRKVAINEALAEQLGLNLNGLRDQKLTLRIPKPSQMPSESSLGKKDDLVESLVELEIAFVVPNKSIGRFGLHISQLDSPNIYLPIELLQDSLSRSALAHKQNPQANVIFLSAKTDVAATSQPTNILAELQPELSDFGLTLKEVSQLKADDDEHVFEYLSLSSDRMVLSDQIVEVVKNTFPDAQEVFTYLANDIRNEGMASGIPFSMISAIDFGDQFPLLDVNDQRIEPLGVYEIVLNEWAAADLNAKIGDDIRVKYFEPEAAHGTGDEVEFNFKVKAIAKLSEPDTPFRVRRRRVIDAQYLNQSPTLANDPDLTPEVPGLTDAESIERWDLPFATADKLRAKDDEYWNMYRTTPKGFISLQRGQQLWDSRFGKVTSFRIPVTSGNLKVASEKLLTSLHAVDTTIGFSNIPIRRQAVAASSGSTPFDALFLALSMFVIGAALILVALLFRLTLQRRSVQTGILMALGLNRGQVSTTILIEMVMVALLGVVVGVAVGVGYAWLMIYGLKTWWLGAISKPILELHTSSWVLAVGALCGLLICLITIVLTIRGLRKIPIRNLLAGDFETGAATNRKQAAWRTWSIVGMIVVAVGLSVVASFLGGEPQAGAFMGSGFFVLAAALLFVFQILIRSDESTGAKVSSLNLRGLASRFACRNPLRSTLTIGLVAVAAFLIMAVSSFRLSPTNEGTAGFDLIATSDQPVFDRLNEASRDDINAFSFRVKSGEDASCTNLYQSTQPQVIGVPDEFVTHFDDAKNSFRWASSLARRKDEVENPWWLLSQKLADGAIPVVIDKNTANYSLKIFAVGGDYTVQFDSGQSVTFRVVGFLENTILQGSLIISEADFIKTFPTVSGYRMFLVDANDETDEHETIANSVSSRLEEKYGDQGFDAQSAISLLGKYQQVQNTYISTFQTLGALGLLLGTFGLAVVQIRSVLERQQELGLMRSVGFSLAKLSRMVLLESIWLLLVGLLVGIGAALVTTLPHYLFGGASIPWMDLAVLFGLILVFGLLAAWLASRTIARMPLVQSLRG